MLNDLSGLTISSGPTGYHYLFDSVVCDAILISEDKNLRILDLAEFACKVSVNSKNFPKSVLNAGEKFCTARSTYDTN